LLTVLSKFQVSSKGLATPHAASQRPHLLPVHQHVRRFKPSRARQIIAEVLRAKLTGAAYNADNTSTWTREIADEIKQRLKSELPAALKQQSFL
jgi:hypothetical protein